jgi:hypothetical protein
LNPSNSAKAEAQLFGDMLHLQILSHDRCGDSLDLFVAGDLKEKLKQLRAQALLLSLIADRDGELRLFGARPAA